VTEDDAEADSIDIELRSPRTVARRCIILTTILRRFSIDATPHDDPNEAAFDFREWLRAEGLWDDATQGEQAFFMRPSDKPEPEGGLDLALSAESLSTIAWALGLLPSLADDHLAELSSLVDGIPAPWETTALWIAAQTLRPEAEIARMREFQEIWNWRYEIEFDRRSAKGRDLSETERVIHVVTHDAIAADLLPPGQNGGFTFNGVAVTAMDSPEIAGLQLLTQERLVALNWICGFGDGWDNVPVDV
jgi:hypothetical protein